MFVTSTRGRYVFSGVPQYPWQVPFGASLLHEHTDVPVAHPYPLDPNTNTGKFRWSYLLMPGM